MVNSMKVDTASRKILNSKSLYTFLKKSIEKFVEKNPEYKEHSIDIDVYVKEIFPADYLNINVALTGDKQ